jgi:hypothetical protein
MKSRPSFVTLGLNQALTFLLMVVMMAGAAFAQTEFGQITGSVTDPQGAAVTGATVKAKNTDTGFTRETNTGGDGNYTLANLQPGLYEVSVTASGFKEFKQQARVTVGGRTALDAALEVGGGTESVEVVAGEANIEVNTNSQELTTVVNETQLRELPTITRNPYALVQLSGNISEGDPTGRGAGVSINGQRAAGTNILLDGASNNDEFTATPGQAVPLDSVQEFSVITSNYSAEFGRASAGIVNVATKSGSNEWHGTIYEFNRISRLASQPFDEKATVLFPGDSPVEKSVFTRNQFGFSVGGPIIEDKLLIFGSAEWIKVRSIANTFFTVPTSDLVAASDPALQAFMAGESLGDVSVTRVITVGDIPGLGAGAFADLGAGFPAFTEVVRAIPSNTGAGDPQDSVQFVVRGDWNITDNMTAYFRHAFEDINFFEGTVSNSPWLGYDTGAEVLNNNFLASVTYVWTPTFVTTSKFTFNRLFSLQPLVGEPGPTLYLTGTAFRTLGTGAPVAFPGNLPLTPGNGIPFGGPQKLWQFYQDANWSLGNHQLRFGGSYVRIHDDRTFGAYQTAVEQLGSTTTSALNNLVLGRIRSFQGAVDPQGHFPGEEVTLPVTSPNFTRENRYNEWAMYFNDAWKIHPRVTLNLGLRYEYYGVQHNKDRSLDSNFYYLVDASLPEQLATGEVFLTDDSPVGDLYAADRNNFAPRVGIAWDVFGDGTTSLRGGYGIGYERNFGNVTFNVIQNPPNYAVISVFAQDVGEPFLPIYTTSAGPLEGTGSKVLPPTSLRALHPDLHNAYSHFWSVALERELWGNTRVSAEYSGSKGVDLYTLEFLNGPLSGTNYLGIESGVDPLNILGRLNGQYTQINTRRNEGSSIYHGLTLGIDSADIGDSGLQMTAKYTWSHAIDNLSSTFSESGNNFNLGLLDPLNPDLDRGNADFDVRHRLVTSGVWNIPFAKDLEGWQKHVFDGWSLTYIFNARTGFPFTVYDCTNGFLYCIRVLETSPLARDGSGEPLPSQRPGDTEDGNRYVYLDLSGVMSSAGSYSTAAIADQSLALFGFAISDYGPFPSSMTARNAFRGPGFWNLDGGVSKNIDITENWELQLRAEFYNIFNHANLFVSGAEPDVSSIDYVPAFYDGRRQVQLAAKIIF